MAAEKATNIGVPDGVYKDLRAFCDRRRLVLKDVAGDVLRWFLSQPESVRSVVLDVVDQGLESAYAAALDELARQLRAAAPPHMNEHDDIGPPEPEEEPLKRPGASAPTRPGKPGRPRGTPLPPTRGGVLPGGRLH